jgi:hypothetical protein
MELHKVDLHEVDSQMELLLDSTVEEIGRSQHEDNARTNSASKKGRANLRAWKRRARNEFFEGQKEGRGKKLEKKRKNICTEDLHGGNNEGKKARIGHEGMEIVDTELAEAVLQPRHAQ